MAILEHINSPQDLKSVPQGQLPELANEIREYMVDVTSRTGGHLAPSLGVVELTIALHYIFNTPADKIIWDVGHQSYTHKIITGRREAFKTLRQYGGISGFPKRGESQFDAFGTGHASTSISAAMGIAKAFKKRGLDSRAIAVVGDGAMTGGLAFEALNQAGYRAGNLIVVLNDNEMSISRNVGALSKFFSVHLHSRRATVLRRSLKRLLIKLLPRYGAKLFKIARKAEGVTAAFLTPGFLFEAFGFHYIGPLNGHNIDELIHVFKDIQETPIGETPILVHVLTTKGKGYEPAEKDVTRFHGIGPFDKATGKQPDGKVSYTQVAGTAILELARTDPKIIAITAAMATGTGMEMVARELPDQFYDVGIAEPHAVTFSAGLATEGFRPVAAIYSTFLQRAFDQIVHDVALQNLPVTLAIDRAGIVGDDGPTHHGTFDLSYLRLIPNMVVMAPRDENMLRHMLFTGIYSNRPAAIRYPRGSAIGVKLDEGYRMLDIGKAEVLYGDINTAKVAVIAIGSTVYPALEAARPVTLKGAKGLLKTNDVVVIDAQFVKPLDEDLLARLANRVKNWITVEENVLAGGFGSAISEWLVKTQNDDVRLKTLGIPDEFVEHGAQGILRARYKIDADGIAKAVREIMMPEVEVEREREKVRPVEIPITKHQITNNDQ